MLTSTTLWLRLPALLIPLFLPISQPDGNEPLIRSARPSVDLNAAEPTVEATFSDPPTIFGVGDIVQCARPEKAAVTGRLMEQLLNQTPNSRGVTFGDNSNDDGSEASYECFDRSPWGKLMPWLYPTPGNHDYGVDQILPYYFLYFPKAGGATGKGYYSYEFGSWHVIALNTELNGESTPISVKREQLIWLENDLRQHSWKCTLAYFHRPPFSSGRFASPAWAMPLFRKLYKYGVDLVATGHEHFFSALPPLNPDGQIDRHRGIPILIAGTGGAVQFPEPRTRKYDEVLITNVLGVVGITLAPGAYDWRFVPVNPNDSSASGTGRCHENPPGFAD